VITFNGSRATWLLPTIGSCFSSWLVCCTDLDQYRLRCLQCGLIGGVPSISLYLWGQYCKSCYVLWHCLMAAHLTHSVMCHISRKVLSSGASEGRKWRAYYLAQIHPKKASKLRWCCLQVDSVLIQCCDEGTVAAADWLLSINHCVNVCRAKQLVQLGSLQAHCIRVWLNADGVSHDGQLITGMMPVCIVCCTQQ